MFHFYNWSNEWFKRQSPVDIAPTNGEIEVENLQARLASDNKTPRMKIRARRRLTTSAGARRHHSFAYRRCALSQPPQHALNGCALKCIAPVARRKTINQTRSYKIYLSKTT